MSEKKLTVKDFIIKVLTGMSIGIVTALIPSAILGEIGKALNMKFLVLTTGMATSLLTVVMGLCVGMQFSMTPLQTGSLAIATIIGSGALKMNGKILQFAGMGDVITAGITSAIAVLILLYIGDKLKAYTMLLVPAIVIVVAGTIGLTILPYVSSITRYLGNMINMFTNLQPVLMGTLISITFAFLIVSPMSTVAVAVAISMQGVASGTANLGVTAAGFCLAVIGFKVNGLGTSLVHIMGSSKIQMANFVKKPKMMLPVITSAGILGALGGLQRIQGTTMSAGFGLSGLIGPINHLNVAGYTTANIIVSIAIFSVIPLMLGFIMKYLYIKVLKIVTEEDYLIPFK